MRKYGDLGGGVSLMPSVDSFPFSILLKTARYTERHIRNDIICLIFYIKNFWEQRNREESGEWEVRPPTLPEES